MLLLLFCLSVLGSSVVFAQDIDNVVTPNGRKPFTLLDEIEDRGERADFLRLYQKRDPLRRRSMAEAFLNSRPQSWLLATVYEIAAKAAIDLNDFPAALRFGKASLRILPENPFLLVPLANVQVQEKAFREAESSANDALEYLDRFGRPASIEEPKWPRIEKALRASSYYVLGLVAASEGLAATGPGSVVKLRSAALQLSRARELNGDDSEISYLLGLVQKALGNGREAVLQFRAAARKPGPLRQKAIEQLRALERFEAESQEPRAAFAVQAENPVIHARQNLYAGSTSCRPCHAGQHTAWEQTGMARMFRPYRRENVIGDFDQPEFQDNTLARMNRNGDALFFESRGAGGHWNRYSIDYTIGSKWQQAYASKMPNGEIHVFPLQYSKVEKTWLNYWKLIDPPGSERTDPNGFYHLKTGTNYLMNCAPCHTSQLGAPRRDGVRPQDLSFHESGVNCEMCHGPSALHVEEMSAGRPRDKQSADPPVDFRRLDHREYVRICAQCHMQSAMRELRAGGEYNYAASGNSFAPTYPSRPFVEFSRRAFYKDGRFRETTFIVEAFMRSACYRRGQASCGNCHDPHPSDAADNPTSLKYRNRPDEMCVGCHQNIAAIAAKHTHHAPDSEASRCVSCHMPRIMNSLLFMARTHQIDDIPRPEMTARFGPQDSPNSCLLCHRDKDAEWVAQKLRAW